jgi:hypothetical protein
MLPRLSAAAVVLLLLAAGFTIWQKADAGPKVSYAYSQEVSTAASLPDWDEDEESFTRILEEIDARNEPGLNTLRLELDELTAAKEDYKAILVAYGEDPNVVRQLAEIERDRSDIYRRIIVEL